MTRDPNSLRALRRARDRLGLIYLTPQGTIMIRHWLLCILAGAWVVAVLSFVALVVAYVRAA